MRQSWQLPQSSSTCPQFPQYLCPSERNSPDEKKCNQRPSVPLSLAISLFLKSPELPSSQCFLATFGKNSIGEKEQKKRNLTPTMMPVAHLGCDTSSAVTPCSCRRGDSVANSPGWVPHEHSSDFRTDWWIQPPNSHIIRLTFCRDSSAISRFMVEAKFFHFGNV